MSNLRQLAKSQISKFPEVQSLIVTDEGGALLEVTGAVDGEALGAVHAVAMQALARCGEALGVGALQRASVSSALHSSVIAVHEHEILGVKTDGFEIASWFLRQLQVRSDRMTAVAAERALIMLKSRLGRDAQKP